MDGFFGIGIQELFLIAIVALIVLGPERLPATLREVAKFIRQVRNLTRDFTQQFGDDFKALEDLDPRRILQQAITSIDEEEEAKDPKKAKATPAKATTTTATAKSTVKPTPAKATTPTTPAKAVATTPAKSTTPATATAKPTEELADQAPTIATVSEPISEPVAGASAPSPTETENRIAPPEVINATQAPAEPAANTVVYSSHTNGVSNEGAKTISAPPTSEALTPVSVATNGTQDHPVAQPD